MKQRLAYMVGVVALMLSGSFGAAIATEDFTKHPGYMDLSSLNVFGKQEADVEVLLEPALLSMVAAISKNKDPEFADMLSKLKQIRVQTFEIPPDKLEAIESKTTEMAHKLESQGWTTMVKVRERSKGSQTYIYSKLVNNKIQGLVVMNVEPKEEASFINIVGEIDPEQLGKLSGKFDIQGLDSLGLQIKTKISDDEEKKRDKK